MNLVSRAVGLVGVGVFATLWTSVSAATEIPDTTKWSIERKVGQLFMIGFPQTKVDDELRAFIQLRQPGGFILFRRNLNRLDQIRTLTSDLATVAREAQGADPFLAVDQEGGSVTRIQVFPALPSAYSIGAGEDQVLSETFGTESGKILSWAGFNMNLAPVLDLSNPSRASFIGPRSFGADPKSVATMGTAYAKGLLKAGVLPTAKHFPGLGSTMIDLHKAVASSRADRKFLEANDLLPFQSYADLDSTLAVMVSQMSYPALDPKGTPAPFSRPILHELLRTKMGFRGLVITDDLQMAGSSLHHKPAEAALESLRAGADVVMISWSFTVQSRAFDRVVRAVRDGEWPVQELDDRVKRILTVKTELSRRRAGPSLKIGRGPSGEPATKQLEKADLRLLDKKIAKRVNRRTVASVAVLPSTGVCVFSTYDRFLQSFQQGSASPVRRIVITPRTTASELTKAIRTSCRTSIMTVSGPTGVGLLEKVDIDLRPQITVVNLGLPVLTKSLAGYTELIEIGFPHLHAGYRVAQIIGKRQKKTGLAQETR